MIPEIGQHIRCLLRNNLIVEGIVESWSDAKSILRSLDGTSVSIIQHCAQDIVVIKIILNIEEPVIKRELETQLKTELEMEFEKNYQKPSDDELRLKSMADLKTLMIRQEKKIIAERIKDHHITETKKVNYGQPGFFKKPST